jgi:hypothetical protein
MYSATAATSKARRQSTACNWCRSHKLKCDTQQPSCRNCQKRGIACTTTNLRSPGQEGQRVKPFERHRKRSAPSPAKPSQPSIPKKPSIFAVPFDQLQAPIEADGPRNTDLTVITDKSQSRRQLIGSGSSLYSLVQWLDLFFANKDGWDPIFPYFQQGLAYSTEVPLSFPRSLPELPSAPDTDEYILIFFSRIHPIFPIFDQDAFRESIDRLRQKQKSTLESKDYPALACAYAVFSASADEVEGQITPIGSQYLQGAYALFANIVATPYITSVQALLTLTLILRNRNKDGASWGILGQAIRIGQSTQRPQTCMPESGGRHTFWRELWSSKPEGHLQSAMMSATRYSRQTSHLTYISMVLSICLGCRLE